MAMKKFKIIFKTIVYFLLVLGICGSATFLFRSFYYKSIFVDGESMSPNLSGSEDNAHYGITDPHKNAINKIKRFDIITTYYPWADYDNGELKDDAVFKIKRVIALPGETFSLDIIPISNAEYTVISLYKDGTVNERIHLPFIPYDTKELSKTTLSNDEYWVMGDNWSSGGSNDCYSHGEPIKRKNITGKLVAIEGVCERYYTDKGVEKARNKKRTKQILFPFVNKNYRNPYYG